MSENSNMNFAMFDGIGTASSTYSQIPRQTLKKSEKNNAWKKATVDALERIGIDQLKKNLVFAEWRLMYQGKFTYLGTGISNFQELPWFDKEVRTLRDKVNIPTYIKHFDFIGIVTNALAGIYNDLDDKYRVDSLDEYFTNEYIRQKTEMLHQYAQQTFTEELNKMLRLRGVDPQKNDFKSEEEAQAYKQEVEAQTKALTPQEIEENLSKNFKVVATEWAQNVLTADKKRYYLKEKDRENFVNFLLTGRYFRHYRVGYDSYYIEDWLPEETFFSQDYDIKYPQDGEFAGRIKNVSVHSILNTYGHLMTTKQQEDVGNYWNQSKDNWQGSVGGKRVDNKIFPQPTTVPFHNYHDHLINIQLENALGRPLGVKTVTDVDGNEESFSVPIPREMGQSLDFSTSFSQNFRDDIDVRTDTVRVTEGYWKSSKRLGVLIHENEFGSLSVDLVEDDLLSDLLKEREIKTLRNISLIDLQKALKDDNLEEYKNTITYIFVPEVWKFVKIRGNGSTLKEDLYLDVRPLDYQIRGENSDLYDLKLPITGIIDVGIASKLEPYQQLHNICMNQITELLEKELGVFFTFDITGLPSEYQNETTQESIFRIRENIKDTGMFGLDLSRQNTQGNNPNIFQRQEVVYATQVQYRWELAKQYKAEGLAQIGITPQILGTPNTYTTAEGVKQGQQASYASLNHYMDKMNTAKAKSMEVHLAIAQYCESEGKEATIITRKGDSELSFLNILKEDGELFSMRKLSVHPETNSTNRNIVQQLQQFILSDNTLQRDFEDVVKITTNPVLVELTQIGKDMRVKADKNVQDQRAFEEQQLKTQIDANTQQQDKERAHEKEMTEMKIEGDIQSAYINSLGRASDKKSDMAGFDRIDEAAKQAMQDNFKEREVALKESTIASKQDDSKFNRSIELRKLALETEALRLKDKAIEATKQNSLVNKN